MTAGSVVRHRPLISLCMGIYGVATPRAERSVSSVVDTARRVILVSGGSRGLGAAIVRQCYGQGFAVATFSRSRGDFITEAERNDADGRLFWRSVDARDGAALQDFVAAVGERFG